MKAFATVVDRSRGAYIYVRRTKMHKLTTKMGFLLLFVFVCLVSEASSKLQLANVDGQWNKVEQLSYNMMKAENVKTHNTKMFRHQQSLHVQHGLDFQLALQPHHGRSQDIKWDEPFTFKLIENDADPVFSWTQRAVVRDRVHSFYLHVNRSIPVGKYALYVTDPCSEGGRNTVRLGDVFVMFNHLISEIEVEVENGDVRIRRQMMATVSREEYIENNCGYIWIGNGAIPWNYAVGSQAVTDSTSALMQMMTQAERKDQVLYSRAMSQLVGNEVVRGRWDGYYSDGKDPTQWVGSEAILSRWLRTRAPVRYGQCWVFAAILTTVLRASGIPARSITNYDSHHDRGLTDDGTAVLRQYDNIIQEDESTWNFHVWTEAWLERPDLGQPSEWNAVDATPQEPSPLAPGQPYRAGPAYVPFIRADMRNESYDNYFILAEVNARKICPRTGKLLPSAVGTEVVTKKPGMQRGVYSKNNGEIITKNYKIPTTSKRASDEEEALILPRPYVGCERDGGMRLSVTPLSPMVGEDFMLTVTEGNVSTEDTVIRMELMSYMGESLGIIDTFTGSKELNVTEMNYLPYLGNSSVFRFTVGAYNQSGGFEFHDDLRIRLEYSELTVEAMRATNSTTISLVVTYTNPLSIPMTEVVLSIASPDNTYMRLEQPDISARSVFTERVEVQCGTDDEGDVMIPISLDSGETQSAYGMGWSSCRDDNVPSGGDVIPSMISRLLLKIISLIALFLFL